jgi:pyruvate formate-lyase activating enzyme-like uncharacterized protein
MKARVLVTLDCNRNCDGCCNKGDVFKYKTITDIKELLTYDCIIITGGEPMLIANKVLSFVVELRNKHNYKNPIFLYTALYTPKLYSYYGAMLGMINGIHFTLHNECSDDDVKHLKYLSYTLMRQYPNVSRRLAIDSRLYDKFDFSNIDFSGWDVVRKLKWVTDCPLPDQEELLYFKL